MSSITPIVLEFYNRSSPNCEETNVENKGDAWGSRIILKIIVQNIVVLRGVSCRREPSSKFLVQLLVISHE